MKARIETWLRNIENGNIRSKTERILDCIIRNGQKGISTDEMRSKLGIAHQTLTGVLSGLNDSGVIQVVGMHQNVENENFYSVYQFVSDPFERTKLQNYREREKVLAWLKKGIEDYEHFCTPIVSKVLYENYDKINRQSLSEPIQLTLFNE
jgi:hypothetical protein